MSAGKGLYSMVADHGFITTSVFELFKVGPGPSSSHTIAPMLAGLDFRRLMDALPEEKKRADACLEVQLYGSLSAAFTGHGTDKAILTGLLGYTPENCPPNLPSGVLGLPEQDLRLPFGSQGPLSPKIFVHGPVEHQYPYSNTLIFVLRDAGGQALRRVYYSVGGGFLQWEGWTPPERGKQPHPFSTARELQAHVIKSGLSIPQIILQNEKALTGQNTAAIHEKLDSIIEAMRRSVARGVSTEGALPGTLNVYRKAARLARKADALDDPINRFLGLLNAYAFAVSEENAAGGVIVTAPTCGAAGVLPSMCTMLEGYFGMGQEALRAGMLTAAAIGFLAKHNASIAGAEVGCQGEVGVASAMAAAMLAQVRGYDSVIVENAAEIALEHHLGLTCDPVGGYVQIPCIERNAMGALKAYNACLVAMMEDVPRHRVNLDMALKAMAETGRDMLSKYRETSRGGLAVCMAEC
ncbi:MAG: L-serine ammonia-lyase [Desulfovibrio sp.]|nr:L-serine ammonia-lyase [Desulfovibrio sp.]